MKQQDVISAHVNSLKSALHSAEIQMNILNNYLGEKPTAKGKKTAASIDDDDADEDETDDEEEETTTKKTKGKKDADEDLDEDFDDSEEDEASMDADEDDAPVGKKKKKAAASVDDEDETDEEEEETKSTKTKKKTSKVSLDDVNDAAKAFIAFTVKKSKGKITASKARAKVAAILDEEFGVESVTDLSPSDYAAAVKEFTV